MGTLAALVARLGKNAYSPLKKPNLTFACSPYDRLRALMDGTVQVEGVGLNFIPLQVEETFWRQIRHREFEASEMSLSSYVVARSRGDDTFIAIPAFTSRFFRHSCVYINTQKGITRPEDLKGKTIGIPEYQMTAAVWLRGIFQDEYGVQPKDVKWRRGGLETPGRQDLLEPRLPEDIDYAPLPKGKTLSETLDAGEVDAIFTARAPSSFAKGSPTVKRLWDNYTEIEGDYYRRTRIFPIMHTVAIKRSFYNKYPWVAQSLFKALVASKNIALRNLQTSEALHATLPWLLYEAERTKKIMGEDWWPYGIEKNRETLKAFCHYSFEQSLSVRKMAIEELFAPETFDEFKV